MEREQILSMDPFILVSWANMKLRDHFDSLEGLCEEFGLEHEDISGRLEPIGYCYNIKTNQFTGIK